MTIFQEINWKKVREGFLDILFPRFCFGCGKEGIYICKECDLFLTENNLICPICGESNYNGETHIDCSTKYTLDGLVSVWDYEGVIRRVIISIKGKNHYHAGEKLVQKAFGDVILNQNRFIHFLDFLLLEDLKITFVPAHKNKRNNDIYQVEKQNHAQEIAKALVDLFESGPEVVPLLKKSKKTKKQSELTKKERLKNVKDAFEIRGAVPKNVVLVDDVFTTGATMRECANKLKRGGAEKVWGFTLARTV